MKTKHKLFSGGMMSGEYPGEDGHIEVILKL
jgi:hypothetical protein